MNEPGPVTNDGSRVSRPVFVSYATADRKQALSVCKAIERRGTQCWISTRDVAPGENYQEAIVRSLRESRAMVLVFSDAANNSDEIKKELSLASRYHVPVMALRIEDVEPSDAFAYELSTRQWIDAFAGWDKSIDALVRQIDQLAASKEQPASSTTANSPLRTLSHTRSLVVVAAVVALPFAIGGAWWFLRPAPAAAHSMMVRLTGFQRLSADLPGTMPDTVHDEIIAAFGDQGVVGISTASAPAPGPAPAYALGGTIRRDGDHIRIITRLTNERSGATLWSSSADYDSGQMRRVPRWTAVNAARMVRCGLFGASTYSKPLSDAVLADYMQYCQTAGVFPTDAGKGLDFARRVVAAAPDFSWGWSAVTLAAAQGLYNNDPGPRREEVKRLGLQAAEKALAIDSKNSEALAQKSILIDPADFVGQEKLLRQAIAARPLDCGCEHVFYGMMLQNVGRYAESTSEFRRATEILALDSPSQFLLADALTAIGKRDEAKPHFDATAELADDPSILDLNAVIEATETGDYVAGIWALRNPKLPISQQRRAALLEGFQAMASGDAGAKSRAVQRLVALPDDQKNYLVAKLLAVLGAKHEAFDIFVSGVGSRSDWPSLLWYPSMRGVLYDPGFPGVAQRLGLTRYWKATHTKPDVCASKVPPPFCRMI